MLAPMLLLPFLLACSSPPTPTHALASPAEGWGAVLWDGDTAVRYGGGDVLVSPHATGPATPSGATTPDRCGGTILTGAPPASVLAPPHGTEPPTPFRPPAMPAPLVEAALWRVDELLPPADAYTPIDPAGAPAKARGVAMGSVVKTRRSGAPPVLVVSGERSCTAVLAVLDAQSTSVLDAQLVPGICGVPRVLPPTDLDNDGAPETALFTDERVVAARLHLASGAERLALLGDWACPPGD